MRNGERYTFIIFQNFYILERKKHTIEIKYSTDKNLGNCQKKTWILNIQDYLLADFIPEWIFTKASNMW